jgi:lipoprotein-anchoring transpeptidase ErfK/SrfK
LSTAPVRAPLAIAAAALLALPAAAGATSAAPPEPAAPTLHRSWTAQILLPARARAAPRGGARVMDRLVHYTAFSRRAQVLMVTGVRRERGRVTWVRVQVPRRPNGTNVWLRRQSVLLRSLTTRLRVRTGARRVEVWRDGRRVASYPAAVGTGGTPTPTGLFAVQDPVASSRSYLGPYILTLTAHSTVLRSFMGGNGLTAIHGTNAPGLLGRAVSNGCIRVSNRAVSRLYDIVSPGMPVEVVRT